MVGVIAVVSDGFDDAVSAIVLTREVQTPDGDSSSMLLVVIRTSAMLPSTLRAAGTVSHKRSSGVDHTSPEMASFVRASLLVESAVTSQSPSCRQL